MQTISHSTRAYITNAEGLKGFLVYGIPELVLKAPEEAHQWQSIDIQKLCRELTDCKAREKRL